MTLKKALKRHLRNRRRASENIGSIRWGQARTKGKGSTYNKWDGFVVSGSGKYWHKVYHGAFRKLEIYEQPDGTFQTQVDTSTGYDRVGRFNSLDQAKAAAERHLRANYVPVPSGSENKRYQKRSREGKVAMDKEEERALRSAGFAPRGNSWYRQRGRYAAVIDKVSGSLRPYAIFGMYDDKMWSGAGAHSISQAITKSIEMADRLKNNPGPKLKAYMKSKGHL